MVLEANNGVYDIWKYFVNTLDNECFIEEYVDAIPCC